jgi:hypothetical protein
VEKGESKGKGKGKYGRRELHINQRADTIGTRRHKTQWGSKYWVVVAKWRALVNTIVNVLVP